MKNILRSILLAMAFTFFCASIVLPQSVKTHKTQEEANKNAGQGIIFKIPDGVMPMEWKEFKGILMLYPKRPGGLFISYPNAGESVEQLKKRIATTLVKMFIHDEKKSAAVSWIDGVVPSHPGDKGANADVKQYESDVESVQIVFYERERNGLNLIYGHFARKSKTSKDKDDSSDFLDAKGNGSKPFDKLWKSFPEL